MWTEVVSVKKKLRLRRETDTCGRSLSRIHSYTRTYHESGKIPNLSRANCELPIQPTKRAYHMCWESNAHERCVTRMSCFLLGSFAGPSRQACRFLENFHPGSRHYIIGIPANQARWLGRHIAKLIFVAWNKGAASLQREPGWFM